ncbi:MAG: hypothetical protein WKF87_05895 [Chryseolinea sp.]
MNRKLIWTVLMASAAITSYGQKNDTVTVELAKASKVIFTIGNPEDIETLKHYDFQSLFQDILVKLETKDTTSLPGIDSTIAVAEPAFNRDDWNNYGKASDTDDDDDSDGNDDNDNDDDNDDDYWDTRHQKKRGRTWQSFNLELGTNNYLNDGKFPNSTNELHSVRPWGSWYVGLASIQRTRLGKKVFLEWGVGVNWYNFKFEDDNILIRKDDDGVTFVSDTRDLDFVKSKLTTSFVTASLVPVIDFGESSRRARFWDTRSNAFRFGVGPYLGYRIASYTKLVYNDEDNDKKKEKDSDSFYLNNMRYGIRLQLGYRSTDLFFNYDLNEMFVSGKGPNLNAFSFGVVF